MADETYAIRLTPAGRGAVASVLVAGPNAWPIVRARFVPAHPLGPAPPQGQIRFGRWEHAGGEEIVLSSVSPERIELHCHGGEAAPAALLRTLVAAGCRELGWEQWLARGSNIWPAYIAQALASALSERTAAILLDQYQGALARAATDMAALIDCNPSSAADLLHALLALAPLGRHLTDPWRVVLGGPVNAGKSSLCNALLGFQRAIVAEKPGTTRDVVATLSAIDGWPVEVCDTAGLRAADDPLESAGVLLAERQLATADLVLLVLDGAQTTDDELATLAARWPQALVVLNKSDLPSVGRSESTALRVSALTGAGLPALQQAIADKLVPAVPPAGAAVPLLAEHVATLVAVLAALDRGDRDAARRLLADLASSAPRVD